MFSVFGENNEITLTMRRNYGEVPFRQPGATLVDLREAVATLEDTERTAQRVLGGAHPVVAKIGRTLRASRETLAAREAP